MACCDEEAQRLTLDPQSKQKKGRGKEKPVTADCPAR